MQVLELKDKLQTMGVSSSTYSINSAEYPNEAYSIFWNGSEWEVYYSERGQKRGLKMFVNEADACEYFVKLITRCHLPK